MSKNDCIEKEVLSMKKSVTLLLILLFLGWTASGVQAQFSKVGTSGAQFLKIGVGARAASLGGAFVANASDASALYWNPAAISRFGASSLIMSYTDWFVDVSNNFVGFVAPMGSQGAVGISATYLGMGRMLVTTVDDPEGTNDFHFSAYSMAAGLTYARNMTDRLQLGVTFKYIREAIWDMTANGFAVDVGTLYHTGFRSLRFAMVIQNFGPSMMFHGGHLYEKISRYGNEKIRTTYEMQASSYPLPITFRMGAAYDLMDSQLGKMTMEVDGVHWNDNFEQGNFGFEYIWNKLFALRAGYSYLPEKPVNWLPIERKGQNNWTTRTHTDNGFTAGMGLNFSLGGLKATFDYSYNAYQYLNDVNQFTFILSF